jgi:DNA polymerase
MTKAALKTLAPPGAEAYLPDRRTLPALRAAIPACRGCALYAPATQAVFGEGPATARIVMIGEQPGDAEDVAGKPFVGPAGRMLDEALAHAKIDRDDVYVTNAVKHFKFTRRGKRRLHDKPNRYEVEACKPWLGAELAALEPAIVVLLGATAAQALLGSSFRVTQARGISMATVYAPHTFATVHPAAVLRAPEEVRDEARQQFFADLAAVGKQLKQL